MRWFIILYIISSGITALEAQGNAEPRQTKPSQNQSVKLLPQPSERYYNIRMKTHSLGVGGVLLKDEYLSPLNYGGFGLEYSQENNQLGYKYARKPYNILEPLIGNIPRHSDTNWLSQKYFIVSLGQTKNPAGNGAINRLQARLSGSRQYRLWDKSWGRAYLGPGYTLGAGGLYSSRNGNNPATLKLDASLSLAITYSYRLPWEHLPILLNLSSRTDLLGLQWGQQFGESYYELYYLSQQAAQRFTLSHLGNSLGQEFRFSLSFPFFDRTIYTLGYRYQHKSWTINQTHNRFDEHSIQVGITRYLQPLGGRTLTKRHAKTLPF